MDSTYGIAFLKNCFYVTLKHSKIQQCILNNQNRHVIEYSTESGMVDHACRILALRGRGWSPDANSSHSCLQIFRVARETVKLFQNNASKSSTVIPYEINHNAEIKVTH